MQIAAMKIDYGEGEAFQIPLQSEGCFALVVVARRNQHIVLGYFFAKPDNCKPVAEDLSVLRPDQALRVGRFSDLGIVTGAWHPLGSLSPWHRSDWPIPKLIRKEAFSQKMWLVSYAEDDPNDVLSENLANTVEQAACYDDGLMGHIFLETILTRQLVKKA